jgi:hypothetical protein
VQLAAAGKKVAVLDIDNLGTHLSQCLPLDRDYLLDDDDQLMLQVVPFRDQRGREQLDYAHRPWVNWAIDGSPYDGKVPALMDLGAQLVVSKNLARMAADQGVGEARLREVSGRLDFYLGSCYVRDIDRYNKTITSAEGATRVTRMLDNLISSRLGYDYLVVDNQPGLSFSAAVSLAWVLRLAQKSQATAHAWFVTQPPWWEQGLVVYETNVYHRFLKRANPVIIVNRLRSEGWIESDIPPGIVFETEELTSRESSRLVGERLFSTPIWKATNFEEDELLEKFATPAGFKFVVLAEDRAVTEGSLDLLKSPSPADPIDPVQRVRGLMERYVASFLVDPLRGDKPPFHQHLSALVDSVLQQAK